MSKLKSTCISFVKTLGNIDYFKETESLLEYIESVEEATLGKDNVYTLYKHLPCILELVNSEDVPGNKKFNFLNEVSLFNGKLKLELFKTENKKTKKALVKHLSNILKHSFEFTDSFPIDQSTFSNPMQLASNEEVLDTIKNNKSLANIVENLTNKLTNDNIDPLKLMSSIMTGDMSDSTIQGILTTVQNDISKIDKSELDAITSQFEKFVTK